MQSKNKARLKRATRIRKGIKERGQYRLSVFRSSVHIYAQVISPDSSKVIAQASTLDGSLKDSTTGNAVSAQKVGELIAQKTLLLGIKKVAFDRSGYKYHGRVKALADGARLGGLEF